MNLQEFKAWFEGFTENMSGVPSAKAWSRIKARVGDITEKPTEVRYFYDHYWRPYYYSNQVPNIPGIVYTSGYAQTLGAAAATQGVTYTQTNNCAFKNPSQAFKALGHADASTLEN